jgi:hypothetical protein
MPEGKKLQAMPQGNGTAESEKITMNIRLSHCNSPEMQCDVVYERRFGVPFRAWEEQKKITAAASPALRPENEFHFARKGGFKYHNCKK